MIPFSFQYPVQQYGLVLYGTNAPGTNECINCFPPTHDLSVFLNQIKEIKLVISPILSFWHKKNTILPCALENNVFLRNVTSQN